MSEANKRQVGGIHYGPGSTMQHWDVVDKWGIHYLEGVASKYPLRWRDKGGIEDLEKTLHYIDKILESHDDHSRWSRQTLALDCIERDVDIRNLLAQHHVNRMSAEGEVVLALMSPPNRVRLTSARHILSDYISELRREQATPGTPEDGGHHARQEESEALAPSTFNSTSNSQNFYLPKGSEGSVKVVNGVAIMEWRKSS